MPNTSTVRIALAPAGRWTEITEASPDVHVVRVRASDLRQGQHLRTRARAEAVESGHDADDVAVFLDIEFHIADDARTARAESARSEPANSGGAAETIEYVGTPTGLAGLIADVKAAHVADGVTLIPRGYVQRNLSTVARSVLPSLGSRGVVFTADAQSAFESEIAVAS